LITPIRSCALVDSAANGIIASFQRLANNLREINPRFLILRRGRARDSNEVGWLAILKCSKTALPKRDNIRRVAASIFDDNPKLDIFAFEESAKLTTHSQSGKRLLVLNRKLENRAENALFELPLLSRSFVADLSSFFQVNGGSADKLGKIVKEFDGAPAGGVLLDLYCGVGAPGLLLDDNYDRLIGAEIDPASAKLAKRNDRLGNGEFYAGDSGEIIKNFRGLSPRTILLDPPRSGLNDATLSGVLEANPARIIYVSCNPATFARDAAKLRVQFDLDTLAPVDMFPHTPCAEIASLWTNRRS
ncbi:MAG: class I SAM-dependent RNA methyltransferase, partial [Desulfovibrio sp.]|nr:class I SAM-dependent RNA methyltransferase [Desulfovibrio sp.]